MTMGTPKSGRNLSKTTTDAQSRLGLSILELISRSAAQEPDHGLPHGLANIHVDFGFTSVMTIAATPLCHRMGIDGRNIPPELRMLACTSIDGQMGIEDQTSRSGATHGGFA